MVVFHFTVFRLQRPVELDINGPGLEPVGQVAVVLERQYLVSTISGHIFEEEGFVCDRHAQGDVPDYLVEEAEHFVRSGREAKAGCWVGTTMAGDGFAHLLLTGADDDGEFDQDLARARADGPWSARWRSSTA